MIGQCVICGHLHVTEGGCSVRYLNGTVCGCGHPADCDGSVTLPDAGFGGQGITYQCLHPSHTSTPEVTR